MFTDVRVPSEYLRTIHYYHSQASLSAIIMRLCEY